MKEIRLSWIKLKNTLRTSYSSYISNEILIDDRLNPLSIRIYGVLNALCFGQEKFESYPSHKLLAYLCNCCTRSIGRNLKLLERLGYIKIKRTIGSVNLYIIVARFCNKVVNAIKSKATQAKEIIESKKNKKNKGFPKQEKVSVFNNYSQRSYSDDELLEIERIHQKALLL